MEYVAIGAHTHTCEIATDDRIPAASLILIRASLLNNLHSNIKLLIKNPSPFRKVTVTNCVDFSSWLF